MFILVADSDLGFTALSIWYILQGSLKNYPLKNYALIILIYFFLILNVLDYRQCSYKDMHYTDYKAKTPDHILC